MLPTARENRHRRKDAVVVDTVIVGGGQAGLVMGRELARQGRGFVILDAGRRVGDAWRERWDSLRLFTAARFDGLPGMPFPGDPLRFPTKDEVADYLEGYATAFGLPVRSGVRVDSVRREDDRYVTAAGGLRWKSNNVIVATGGCRRRRCRSSPTSSMRESCSCTRASIAARRNCRRAPCSSSGWATQVLRSHATWRPRTRP